MNLNIILPVLTLFFGSGVLVAVIRHILNRIKANDKKTDAVRLGVQALLRDRLIDQYNKYCDKGFAPIYVKQNFENMWIQYHNLGVNGVMDEIHIAFMRLPTEKKGDSKNEECKG